MEKEYKVIKRDGKIVDYDVNHIRKAVFNAGVPSELLDIVVSKAEDMLFNHTGFLAIVPDDIFDVEYIQDVIVNTLDILKLKKQKDEYVRYKKEREKIRQSKSDLMKTVHALGCETDRDNGNVGNNFSSKLLRIASETNKAANLAIMPKRMAKYHENCDLHYHDLDSLNLAPNCLHNDTESILARGFNTGYGWIRPPKRITSATNLMCIIIQSCQN